MPTFGVAAPNALFSAITHGDLEAARAALEGGVDDRDRDRYLPVIGDR